MTATELVTMLFEAWQQGRLTRKLAQLACFDIVHAPPVPEGRNLRRDRP